MPRLVADIGQHGAARHRRDGSRASSRSICHSAYSPLSSSTSSRRTKRRHLARQFAADGAAGAGHQHPPAPHQPRHARRGRAAPAAGSAGPRSPPARNSIGPPSTCRPNPAGRPRRAPHPHALGIGLRRSVRPATRPTGPGSVTTSADGSRPSARRRASTAAVCSSAPRIGCPWMRRPALRGAEREQARDPEARPAVRMPSARRNTSAPSPAPTSSTVAPLGRRPAAPPGAAIDHPRRCRSSHDRSARGRPGRSGSAAGRRRPAAAARTGPRRELPSRRRPNRSRDAGEPPVLLRQAERQPGHQQRDAAAEESTSGCSRPPSGRPASAPAAPPRRQSRRPAPHSADPVERRAAAIGRHMQPRSSRPIADYHSSRTDPLKQPHDRCSRCSAIWLFCAGLALVSAVMVRAMIRRGVMDRPDPRKAHTRPIAERRRSWRGRGVPGRHRRAVRVRRVLPPRRSVFPRRDPGRAADRRRRPSWTTCGTGHSLSSWRAGGGGAGARSAAASYVNRVPRALCSARSDSGGSASRPPCVWILFATNAMNFIDGLNGLAAGTALVACAFLALIAAGQGGWFVYFAALLLAAGLARLPAVQLSPRAHLHGRCRQPVLRLRAGRARCRGGALREGGAVVPDGAAAAVRACCSMSRSPWCAALWPATQSAQAHRGHLYQVAHRAGLDARLVALVHWGFAGLGGLLALGFLHAPSDLKPFVLLLAVVPQLVWTGWVASRARACGLGAWG